MYRFPCCATPASEDRASMLLVGWWLEEPLYWRIGVCSKTQRKRGLNGPKPKRMRGKGLQRSNGVTQLKAWTPKAAIHANGEKEKHREMFGWNWAMRKCQRHQQWRPQGDTKWWRPAELNGSAGSIGKEHFRLYWQALRILVSRV